MSKDNTISFILGEESVQLSFSEGMNLSPTTTLLNYLRQLPDRKGTKEGCAEGDCGACTVVIGELVNEKKIKYTAIDSCLVFLPMLHGKWVITVEDLKNNASGVSEKTNTVIEHETGGENLSLLHPVQKAMVENHGTQCGFCTPGIIMSLFGLYKNLHNPSKSIIEDALTGNLCRCTGYRPIIEAAAKACSLSENDKFYLLEKKIIPALIVLNKDRKPFSLININFNYKKAYRLGDALRYLTNSPTAVILSGATDSALRVTKKFEILPDIIDISEVKILKKIKRYTQRVEIGAGVTLSELKNFLEENYFFHKPKIKGQRDTGGYLALYNQLCVFGSLQIRNLATIGGNIGTASPISDLLPVLMAYGAEVALQSKFKTRILKLENFISGYRKTDLKPGELIVNIIIPYPENYTFVFSSKVSNRKNLDIATVNAGFSIRLNEQHIIEDIALFYGGMAAWTMRAVKTEKFLLVKSWNKENFESAMNFIAKDFSPISDARASAEFRIMVARNLLLKLFYSVSKTNLKFEI